MFEFRHNVVNVLSINSFMNIRGISDSWFKDVYFVRAVGANEVLIKEIENMDNILYKKMDNGTLVYKRISSLPKSISPEIVKDYSECYEKWYNSGRNVLLTKTNASNLFSKFLSEAFNQTFKLFCLGKKDINTSIEKNYAIKMMIWLDSFFSEFIESWYIEKSLKIVADNIESRQEYLFFYMLTLIGCDVLLIQSKKDIGKTEEKLKLSKKFVLGKFSDIDIPKFCPENLCKSCSSVKTTLPLKESLQGKQSFIKVTIPERTRKKSSFSNLNDSSLKNTNTNKTPDKVITSNNSVIKTKKYDEYVEKNYEELAGFASSVVMIAVIDSGGKIAGTGSGIMIGKDGYILTNNHVIKNGRFYVVRIEEDDNLYDTDEVIKYNSVFDLAIIRINKKLKPIPVYNGINKLARGQKVVAIGSPLGLFNSVSDGIISGFRKIDNVDMIQFTAPISHGSSGGAVLNMYGEVIGISTAGIDEGQNINLAVSYECINKFIKGFTY